MRSHHALKLRALAKCSHCQTEVYPHTICANCGYYKGKQVIDVLARLDKKERRKKEKELQQHEKESSAQSKTLNAEELSHR